MVAERGSSRNAPRTRPLRILVVVAAGRIEAGPVKGCLQFIRHLRGSEFAFHLVNFHRGDDDADGQRFAVDATAAGVPVEFVTQPGRDYIGLARSLSAIVRRERIDVVQSHGFKPAVLSAWLRLRHRIPWICFCHGATAENWRVRLYNAAECGARLFADRIVLVSEAQRGHALLRLRRRSTRIIRNAVDSDRPVAVSPVRVDMRAQLGLAPDAPLLVAVGRLSPEKGIDVLLEAVSRLQARRHARPHLVLVGDGPEFSALRAQARRAGITERVTFAGHTATPGDYLLAADVVVLPSRSEGIANVALEAMALGRPLVATAVGGTPEIVRHGISGLLVPADDAPALAATIARVLDDDALAGELARGARAHAREELSVAVRCARLRALYAELAPLPTESIEEILS